jgi:HKD family nuclease
VLNKIKTQLRSSESVDIAVAFLKESGYQEIEPELNRFLKKGKTLRLLVGLADFCITDAEPLEELLKIQAKIGKKIQLKYYSNTEFHPKLIIFRETDKIYAIIGSSNFTAGGLGGNIEANAFFDGMKDDPEMKKILAFYERIWSKGAKKITSQIVADYKTSKIKSTNWISTRVNQNRIPRTIISKGTGLVLNSSTAYILGLLLARGEVFTDCAIIRIPCRNPSRIKGHKEFAQKTFKQILESTVGEKVNLNIQHNANMNALEIKFDRRIIEKLLKQMKIPNNVNFGFNGLIPKKIMQANTNIITSFLRGYGDSCGTVGTYFGGKARVVLNLDIRNHGVISELVNTFLSVGISVADVDLPQSGNVFNGLARSLETNGINVTRGTRTPQIRIWGDVYSKEIGFRNDYLANKLASIL